MVRRRASVWPLLFGFVCLCMFCVVYAHSPAEKQPSSEEPLTAYRLPPSLRYDADAVGFSPLPGEWWCSENKLDAVFASHEMLPDRIPQNRGEQDAPERLISYEEYLVAAGAFRMSPTTTHVACLLSCLEPIPDVIEAAPVEASGHVAAAFAPSLLDSSIVAEMGPRLTADLPAISPRPEPVANAADRPYMSVANIPSPIRLDAPSNPTLRAVSGSRNDRKNALPKTPKTDAEEKAAEEKPTDDSWQTPDTLLEGLKSLEGLEPTRRWAREVLREIQLLGPAMNASGDRADAVINRLIKLNCQVPRMAEKIADKTVIRRLYKNGYALGRRLDVWQQVVQLRRSEKSNPVQTERDPKKLEACLDAVDALTNRAAGGEAWRQYLSADALRKCLSQKPFDAASVKQVARDAMVRFAQTPLSAEQLQFVSRGPTAALQAELRRWVVKPVGAAQLLRDIERYERTGLPSDARRLAMDCFDLAESPIEARRQLALRVDRHYRNANVRLAVTGELLNNLLPQQNVEYGSVNEVVLGYPVRGERVMATEMAVRMLPNPTRVRLALEVKGEIAAETTTDGGPARFHSESETYYVARKPIEIDMNGISIWPTEIDVRNASELRGVETSVDSVPLIGSVVKVVAKSQYEQSKPAADREVKRKVDRQARERIDAEVRRQMSGVVDHLNQRVFDPLNSLMLDPQMIDAETTEQRFTMRLLLGGEDQLGGHTPRPQAPADSLTSIQLHESTINNGIQRLRLEGSTFMLPELSQHIAASLNIPSAWEIDPDNKDVKITFARKDAVFIRCQDGLLALTLNIDRLSKGARKWKNFQIQAFYRPDVRGRSAHLVREGVIHLSGPRLTAGSQIALRGIFTHALSKKNLWELVPEPIMKDPRLKDAAVTQFIIDDGWIGVSLGPKTTTVAHRPQQESR